MLNLQSYDFEVKHRKGKQHQNADSMIRPPFTQSENVPWIEDCFVIEPREVLVTTRAQEKENLTSKEPEEFHKNQKRTNEKEKEEENDAKEKLDQHTTVKYSDCSHKKPCTKATCRESNSISEPEGFPSLNNSSQRGNRNSTKSRRLSRKKNRTV